jgi:hypothetical protein
VVETSVPSVKVKDVLPLVTIRAVDRDGNVVENFTGIVRIVAPTDASATLPGLFTDHGEVTFAGKNRGVVSIPWSVSFSRAGAQRLVVSDASGAVQGETTVTVTGSAPVGESNRIQMESPKDGDTVSGGEMLVKGKGPALANLRVWIADASTPVETLTNGVPAGSGETEADASAIHTRRLASAGPFPFTSISPPLTVSPSLGLSIWMRLLSPTGALPVTVTVVSPCTAPLASLTTKR